MSDKDSRKRVVLNAFNSKSSRSSGKNTVDAPVPVGIDDIANRFVTLGMEEKRELERRRMEKLESLRELEAYSSIISLYSEETIRRISVVNVTNPDISTPATPQPLSLYDTHMGSIIKNRKCSSCNQVVCLGHFGRIAFASPIPHPLWLSMIRDILTSVCGSCGGLLVSETVINHNGWNNLPAHKRIPIIASNATGNKECPDSNNRVNMSDGTVKRCMRNPVYSIPKGDEGFMIKTKIKEGGMEFNNIIKVETILSIFKCISDKDARLLGFTHGSRPENLIMQSIIVMPPLARLPYMASNGSNPDNFTDAYRQIVICANQLALNPDNDRIKTNLYFKVKLLMEGKKKQKNKMLKHFMSITDRLQGKQAVPRAFLMGKRTNMCARSVISPDTRLAFGQIRIPREWAPILTIETVVTDFNISYINSLIKEGKIEEIINQNGNILNKKRIDENTVVSSGDRVYRHLQNGDIVVANRQPTLHKFGMMAFETVLGDERTIGLHFAYTTPYNADFDGDEMNIWVPQDLASINEASKLLFVTNNIMSPAKNKVNMGLVYDAITASFLLTRERQVPESIYYDIITSVGDDDNLVTLPQRLKKHKIHPMSGKGIFSRLLPSTFNYFSGKVIIIDGILIAGEITGDHVGPSSRSIVEKLYMEYGGDAYADFITNASYLVLKYITIRGHTVSIADCMEIDPEKRAIEELENDKAYRIIQAKIDALGEIPTDSLLLEQYEISVKNIINSSAGLGFSTIKEIISLINNNIGAMLSDIGGGAKGKVFNIQQIRGRLGQQFKKEERLALSCGNRILPGFDENDTDIRARGYIKSNFMKGLSPEEHFLHMMAARQGLIDTAVNVASMGDIHRRVVKALENLFIGDDMSIVNSNNASFQLLAGADGFDSARLIKMRRPGSSLDPVAFFIDIKEVIRDLNIEAGWIKEKTIKSHLYSSYIIEMTVDLIFIRGGDNVHVDERIISNYFNNKLGDTGYFRQVEIISNEDGRYVIDAYFDTASISYNDSDDAIDLESRFQAEIIENMKDEFILYGNIIKDNEYGGVFETKSEYLLTVDEEEERNIREATNATIQFNLIETKINY